MNATIENSKEPVIARFIERPDDNGAKKSAEQWAEETWSKVLFRLPESALDIPHSVKQQELEDKVSQILES